MTKITIAQITGRRNPRWQWFVDSLFNQVPSDHWPDIQMLFIDRHLWSNEAAQACTESEIAFGDPKYHDAARRSELADIVAGRFKFEHLPPKPCAFQGPFRQTTKDFFCASTSRNSAIVACRSPYLVCADDLAVLGPIWYDQAVHAAKNEYLLAGMYAKRKKLVVENGRIVSFEEFPAGVDSRWGHGSDGGIVKWHGSGLFGCSFGLPLEAALEVDGFDRTGDGAGAEDYCLGIRVERAGWPVYLNRNFFSSESEEAHFEEPSLPREARVVTADRLPAGYNGSAMSDHVMLNRLYSETERITPLLGDGLRALRERYLDTGLVPIPREPQFDWRDGTPLSQL